MSSQQVFQDRPDLLSRGERAVRSIMMFGFFIVLAVETWLLIQIVTTSP